MQIVNMKNVEIKLTKDIIKQYQGFAIMNESGEFLSLNGKDVYIPSGGRKALKALLPVADTFNFVPLR